MFLLRDSDGKKSLSATILIVSWAIAITLIFASMIDLEKTTWGFTIRPVDPSIILFLLAPSGVLYGWRKKQNNKEIQDTMEKLSK